MAVTVTVSRLFKNKRECHELAVIVTVSCLVEKKQECYMPEWVSHSSAEICRRELLSVTVSRMNKNVIGSSNGYNLAFQVLARINQNSGFKMRNFLQSEKERECHFT